MSDPLSLLRESFVNKRPMKHDDYSIFIGDLRFPRNTVTAYKQDRGRGTPYTLDALYFLLQRPNLAGAANTKAYQEATRAENFPKVLLADQKDVLSYLQGKTETSQYLISIDESAAISVPMPSSERAENKRQREEAKLEVLDSELLESKRRLAEHLRQWPLRPPEPGKASAEARGITHEVHPDPACQAYIKADQAVTRSIIEKEQSHRANQSARQSYMQCKTGRDFSHLLSMARAALTSGAHKKSQQSSAAEDC